MAVHRDHEGRAVRLTRERLEHIREHPEMAGLERTISLTLRAPEAVVQSRSDPEVRLHYRICRGTRVGDKLLCVVVKITALNAFVVTAYLTDRIKRGIHLWPRRR